MARIERVGGLLLAGCVAAGDETGQAMGPTVSLSGDITQLIGGEGQGGVTVCVEGTDRCADSAEDGTYSLDVPASSPVLLLATLPEHVPLIAPIETATDDIAARPLSMLSDALFAGQVSLTGATGAEGLGQVVFSVSNGIAGDGINIAGVSARLDPGGGVGPFYLSPIGLPDLDLSVTSDNGGGGWLDVPPGTHALSFEGLPGTCTLLYGWSGPSPLALPVQPGRATVVRIECPG